MNKILYGTAFAALLLASPAFATGLVDSHDTNYSQGQQQGQGQSQGQSATGIGIGKGGNAAARSSSKSSSYSGASASNTTKSLNQQSLKNANTAAQGQSADNNGNNFTSDDDNKTEVYAVSYTDAAPNTVAASIGDGVVVTTWGIKVLGPVFGMTDQHVHYLPSAVEDSAKVAYLATTNDGSYDGERVQFVYIAAVCAHDEKLAEQLNLGCK